MVSSVYLLYVGETIEELSMNLSNVHLKCLIFNLLSTCIKDSYFAEMTKRLVNWSFIFLFIHELN